MSKVNSLISDQLTSVALQQAVTLTNISKIVETLVHDKVDSELWIDITSTLERAKSLIEVYRDGRGG